MSLYVNDVFRAQVDFAATPGGWVFPFVGKEVVTRQKGTTKGVRLIDFQSLVDHINSGIEPAYLSTTLQKTTSDAIPRPAFVKEIISDQRTRIIVSVEVASCETHY